MKSLLALVSIVIILILVLFLLILSCKPKDRFENKTIDLVPSKKYLLFSSVGKRDLDVQAVDMWRDPRKHRNYDIVLYYYDDAPPPGCIDHCVQKQGFKFENFYDFVATNDVSGYEAIFVVDDDIEIGTEQLNELFEVFMDYDLDVGQPAFTHDSIISHPITVQDKSCVLRFCNFVENGVMILSKRVLDKCLPVFKEGNTGWAVDYICCSMLDNGNNIAVIDKVPCKHPHTVSTLDTVIPRPEHGVLGKEMLKKHGIEAYEHKEYSRVKVPSS